MTIIELEVQLSASDDGDNNNNNDKATNPHSELSIMETNLDINMESENGDGLHDEDILRDPGPDPDLYTHRLHELEEEQEQLNSSLIALTSHFAQVQLRLMQIVDASPEEKEQLLKELEEFAFRAIPDTRVDVMNDFFSSSNNHNSNEVVEETGKDNTKEGLSSKLDQQRAKQQELMLKLKCQLEDLEKYAYETGDTNCIPSSMLIERQTVIIEQLKSKLALNLDDMDRLTVDQLKKQVDQALKDLINPTIMKEQLVEQLKTQVSDLERYIRDLQRIQDTRNRLTSSTCRHDTASKCTCDCPLHGNNQTSVKPYDEVVAAEQQKRSRERGRKEGKDKKKCQGSNREDNEEAIKMIKRVMTLLQMITVTQFGCSNGRNGIKRFERNILKKTPRGSHWGDLRARLEVVIDKVIQVNKEASANDSDYTSDEGEDSVFTPANERMILVVRKELAPALKDLMEHGLCQERSSSGNSLIVSTLLDWGCFSARSSTLSTPTSSSHPTVTAWDLIVKYYDFKDGELYSTAPARRLSQSFNLSMVGGSAVTPKQRLLTAILNILETHTPFKRSPESHFKAFISRALNEGKLSSWLRLIMKSRNLILEFYEPWSYTANTGFDDALKSLEKLSNIKFDLPTDLAIRQLTNINEAF